MTRIFGTMIWLGILIGTGLFTGWLVWTIGTLAIQAAQLTVVF